jgi:hypothetical protein
MRMHCCCCRMMMTEKNGLISYLTGIEQVKKNQYEENSISNHIFIEHQRQPYWG